MALQAPREKKELPLGTAASLGEGVERGKAGISPGSHLAPVPSVGMPGPGQGSLGRPSPSPSPTDAHQHGPQLHAARELQAAAKAQRLLQVLLTGLGDSCRDRGQRGSSGPSPKAPVGGAALPPEATETIQRAVTDPRLRARVQELDWNPHPIGSLHDSVIHEPPETAGARGSSPAAVPSPHARDPIVCFSISLVKQCPRPTLGREQIKSSGAHSTPFPGADAGVFVD